MMNVGSSARQCSLLLRYSQLFTLPAFSCTVRCICASIAPKVSTMTSTAQPYSVWFYLEPWQRTSCCGLLRKRRINWRVTNYLICEISFLFLYELTPLVPPRLSVSHFVSFTFLFDFSTVYAVVSRFPIRLHRAVEGGNLTNKQFKFFKTLLSITPPVSWVLVCRWWCGVTRYCNRSDDLTAGNIYQTSHTNSNQKVYKYFRRRTDPL